MRRPWSLGGVLERSWRSLGLRLGGLEKHATILERSEGASGPRSRRGRAGREGIAGAVDVFNAGYEVNETLSRRKSVVDRRQNPPRLPPEHPLMDTCAAGPDNTLEVALSTAASPVPVRAKYRLLADFPDDLPSASTRPASEHAPGLGDEDIEELEDFRSAAGFFRSQTLPAQGVENFWEK